MHGCGWDSGAARERSSALRLPQRRLALRAWRRWRGRCAPGRPWQPGHCLALRARRRRRGRCAPGAYLCPRVTAHVVSWGEWGCRRSRVLRAAREARCKACFELLRRARVGWHTARTLLPPPPPHSSGAPVRWLMARGRRASGVAAAPRSRAAGAPATRRRRAVGGACACRARSNGRRRPCVVVVVRHTNSELPLRQASPDRGKYGFFFSLSSLVVDKDVFFFSHVSWCTPGYGINIWCTPGQP